MADELPSNLLTKKELNAEQYLKNLIKSRSNESVPGTAADISQQVALEGAQSSVNSQSIIFGLRYKSHIQSLIQEKEIAKRNKIYSHITADPPDDSELADFYKTCFDSFVDDSDSVSFKVENEKALGNVTAKDAFILNFWTMATCKRQGKDNMLQIIVSGLTSVGKSTLFEVPLSEVGRCYANEPGVGRFPLDGMSTLLVNDKPLSVLYTGQDMDKFKVMARGEPLNVKVQGKTATILPTFMFVTSNQHLLLHTFANRDRTGISIKKRYKPDHEESVHEELPFKRRKIFHEEDLRAVKARYIEVFVRQPPLIPPEALSQDFNRQHALAGIFGRVVSTLQIYKPEDMTNRYHYLYPIGGLCKNIGVIREQKKLQMLRAVMDLMDRYKVSERERAQLMEDLCEQVPVSSSPPQSP